MTEERVTRSTSMGGSKETKRLGSHLQQYAVRFFPSSVRAGWLVGLVLDPVPFAA